MKMLRTYVATCLLLVCNAVFAQSFTVDNIKYEVLDSGYEVAIAGFEDETQTTLMPPERVTFEGQEYTVTSIGESAFFDCTRLTSVVIPNSVTSIGWRAFYRCWGLTSVVIPNSVTSIGGSAFHDCYRLTSVEIGNSVTSIGSGAFSDCSGLTSVVIPNSVTSIESSVFEDCTRLTSVVIPNSVTIIRETAFYNCTHLTSVVIPNSVASIRASAFSGCTKLRSVTFPQNIYIYENAFSNCTSLKEVVFPDTVKGLQTNSFRNCTALHTVTMPSKCSSIKLDVFQGCSAIKFVIMRSPTPLNLFGTQQTLDGAYLIVPNGSLETYAKAKGWQKWSMYEMDQYTFNFVTIPNKMEQLYSMIQLETQTDFADHGLLTSPSQITTNKLEPTEGSIEALLDNDKETYFHSTWSVANESLDNYHFLEVDLGKTVKEFTLNFARRSHNTVSSPRVIHVYATNDPNGEWEDKGTYTCEHTYYCFVDELWAEVKYTSSMLGYSFNGSTTVVTMDDKYRYVRLEVEQSYASNAGVNSKNNIYFTLSELAIFETFDGYKVDLSRFLTEAERAQMSNDVATITEASAAFSGTAQMVDTLDKWINRIQEGILSGVDQVTVTPSTASKGVYSISGKLVKTQSDNLNDLPKGVYIVNGKKVVK